MISYFLIFSRCFSVAVFGLIAYKILFRTHKFEKPYFGSFFAIKSGYVLILEEKLHIFVVRKVIEFFN